MDGSLLQKNADSVSVVKTCNVIVRKTERGAMLRPFRLFLVKRLTVVGKKAINCQPGKSTQSSRRRCGNRITSRMFGESVINIIKRSIPMPQPPAGGMPYSSARM